MVKTELANQDAQRMRPRPMKSGYSLPDRAHKTHARLFSGLGLGLGLGPGLGWGLGLGPGLG